MLILLVGDTHGNPYAIEEAFNVAHDTGCEKIFVLGDFGYWEHEYGGPEYLDVVSDGWKQTGIPLYWLDGNHENHKWLHMDRKEWTALQYDGTGPESVYSEQVNDEGFWEIRPGVFYSPRGHTFVWDGVSFMTMGGAFSVDRASRIPGKSWWYEEEITDEDIDKAIAPGYVIDVLLAHDVPSGVDLVYQMTRHGKRFFIIPQAEAGRKKLRRLCNSIKPTHVFHGHYHLRYSEIADFGYANVKVIGLDCDQYEPDNLYILDTKDIVPVQL